MGFTEPIGKFFVAIGADTKEFRKELASAQRTLKKALGPEALALSKDITYAMAGAAAAMTAFGAASIAAAADEERNIASMTTLLKSAEKAKLVMEDIDKIGAVSPIPIEEMEKAAQSLVKMGISAGQVGTDLKMLGDISAATKVPLEEIVSVYGKASMNGVLAAKQLKETMGMGIPLVQQLAAQMGRSEEEVRKLGKSGGITFEQMRTAFQGMTAEGGRFHDGMVGAAQTIIGKWNVLANNLDIIMTDIGFSLIDAFNIKPAMDRAGSAMREFSGLVKDQGLVGAISETLGPGLKAAILASAAAITGAMIPAIYSMALAIGASAAAMAVLVPMFKFGAIAAGIVGVGLVVYQHAGDAKDFVIKCLRQVGYHFSELGIGAKTAAADIAGVFAKMGADMALDLAAVFEQAGGPFSRMMPSVVKGYAAMQAAADKYKRTSSELDQEQKQNYQDMQASWAGRSPWGTFTSAAASARAAISSVSNTLYEGMLRMPNPPSKKGGAPESDSGKKLAREVADVTADIKREWISTTKTQKEQIEAQYQAELARLESTRSANKNYQEDVIRLEQIKKFRLNEINLEREEQYQQSLQNMREAEAKLAESAGDAMRRQIDQEGAESVAMADRIEAIRTGQAIEEKLWEDYRNGDLEKYRAHLNAENAELLASLQGRREMMDVWNQMQMESHRSNLSYMAEGYRTLYDGLTEAITGAVVGTKNAAQAMKDLGMQLITMVVKWMVQRRIASAMSKSLEAASAATSMAAGAAVAAAWAPAAALVSAATFGANTAAGAAGLGALNAMARAMAIPGLANGGIVTRPTIAMIGEGRGPEAVIPLDRLPSMSATPVTVNVINNTGQPAQVSKSQRFDGQRMIVDVVLDAYERNVGGLRSVLKGA